MVPEWLWYGSFGGVDRQREGPEMVGVASLVAGRGNGDASGRREEAFRFAKIIAKGHVDGLLLRSALKPSCELVDKHCMTAQQSSKMWRDVDGRCVTPHQEAIVKTLNNFTCLATLQTDGSWREVYGRKDFVDVAEVVLSF